MLVIGLLLRCPPLNPPPKGWPPVSGCPFGPPRPDYSLGQPNGEALIVAGNVLVPGFLASRRRRKAIGRLRSLVAREETGRICSGIDRSHGYAAPRVVISSRARSLRMSSRTKSRLYPLVGVAVVVALLVTAVCMTSQPPLTNALVAADAAGPTKPADDKEMPAKESAPSPRKSRSRASRAPPTCL